MSPTNLEGLRTTMAKSAVWSSVRPRVRAARVRLRLLRGKPHPLPDFLIIGGQRCGTTSLYLDLCQHPQVRAPLGKELQYFTLHHRKDVLWYGAHFPVLGPGEQTFEASPYYLFHDLVPLRASVALPRAKFVALLRNPVERAYSHYLHTRRAGAEPLDFIRALDAEPRRMAEAAAKGLDTPAGQRMARQYSYASRGRYAGQVERWRQAVGPERLLLVKSEDLHAQPQAQFSVLLEFLGLDDFTPPSYAQHTRRIAKGASLVPAEAAERLEEHFRVENERLLRFTGWSHAW